MKIAIHYPTKRKIQEDNYAHRWFSFLEKSGVQVVKLDFLSLDIIKSLRGCDGVMWHFYHMPDEKQSAPKILDAIEYGLQIPVWPNADSRWHFDEKVSQHYLLEAIDAPKINSWVFWNKEDALDFVKTSDYPLVTKYSVGAGSSNVFILKSIEEGEKFVNKMFKEGADPYSDSEFATSQGIDQSKILTRIKNGVKYILNKTTFKEEPNWYFLKQKNYVFFQEFLPNNNYDIRVTVIGDRAFSFVRFNRDNDFRASGSGKINYDRELLSMDAIKIAHEISRKMKFQSMAYDFLKDKSGKILLNEISYGYLSKAVYDCSGSWDYNLKYHAGQIWPEQLHVENFIEYIRKSK